MNCENKRNNVNDENNIQRENKLLRIKAGQLNEIELFLDSFQDFSLFC